MPDTHIVLDPPGPVPAVAAVPLQPVADAAGVAAIAPVVDAFRIRFRAHETNHTLPYLDADGRGAPPDQVFVRSRSGQPEPAAKNRALVAPNAADDAADTRFTHAEIGAPTDWRLDALSGSAPNQWPVGYKEPPAGPPPVPLNMDSVANQTQRYVCWMATVYGIHRVACGACGNRHMPGGQETAASKALCNQFAQQLTAQWQVWRTFWADKAWFSQQIDDPQQAPGPDGVQPRGQRLAILRSNFNHADWPGALQRAIAIRTQLGQAAPANDPFAAVPADGNQAVAKRGAINGLIAVPTVGRPGKFMIGVMIVNLAGGAVQTYAAVSGGEDLTNASDTAKRNLGALAAAAMPPIAYATKRPLAQAIVNWLGAGIVLRAANAVDNPLETCAAPKMLHAFYAAVANRTRPAQVVNVEITEQWFDPIVPDQNNPWHGLTEPSCRTCQHQVPEIMCGY